MKKVVALFMGVWFLLPAQAQQVRLNGYASYVFDDSFDSYYSNTSYYNGTIKGGFRWGLGLEYMVRANYGVELSYLRQDANVPIEYFDISRKLTTLDLGMSWILLGGNRYIRSGGKAEPYGGLQAGVVIMNLKNPLNGREASATKFGWGLRLGTNFMATPKFGIKIQADLLSAVQATGGGFYFGTSGPGVGLNTYSSMLQFGIGGGIVLRLR